MFDVASRSMASMLVTLYELELAPVNTRFPAVLNLKLFSVPLVSNTNDLFLGIRTVPLSLGYNWMSVALLNVLKTMLPLDVVMLTLELLNI
jgi:hypothetical protein